MGQLEQKVLNFLKLARKKAHELAGLYRKHADLAPDDKPPKLWDIYRWLQKHKITLNCPQNPQSKQHQAILDQMFSVCNLKSNFFYFFCVRINERKNMQQLEKFWKPL